MVDQGDDGLFAQPLFYQSRLLKIPLPSKTLTHFCKGQTPFKIKGKAPNALSPLTPGWSRNIALPFWSWLHLQPGRCLWAIYCKTKVWYGAA